MKKLRYFNYRAEYHGTRGPEGYTWLRFELSNSSLYLHQNQPIELQFRGQTDDRPIRELTGLVAGLDLKDWERVRGWQEMLGMASCYLKGAVCRWYFLAVFEPEKPGAVPEEIRLEGVDDGSSPKRLAVEKALHQFFLAHYRDLVERTPRHLTEFVWGWHEGGKYSAFGLIKNNDGILNLDCRRDGKAITTAVSPDIADAATDILLRYGLDKAHGFSVPSPSEGDRISLNVAFDTHQKIQILGHSGPDGMPAGWAPARTELAALLTPLLEQAQGDMQAALPPTSLKYLRFSLGGMRLGPQIYLYERTGGNGPELVLSRAHDYEQKGATVRQADAAILAALEALLERYRVKTWDGFKGVPSADVLDGTSFSLEIDFRDGTSVSASGENCFPEKFMDFVKEIDALIRDYLKSDE